MPLYDFKCLACEREFEVLCKIAEQKDIKCEECGGNTQVLITGAKKDWFREFTTLDFNDTPITVTSKDHYRQLCKEHGVTARCLQ